MSLPLDPAQIRAAFPAFGEPNLQGWAHFENAGGSFTSRHALEEVTRFIRSHKVQPYGVYPASVAAGAAMDRAYEALGAGMGVGADWVHIGPSTSANTYVLASAFREMLVPGDVIVVTNQDHEANTGVFRKLEAEGVEIREWRVNPETACLELSGLDALLDDRVRLVTFPHCSNIVGHINPTADICKRIAQAGAISLVDGVSYAPHGIPDMREIGADIYLFSAYKTYGPHQGVMAIRPEIARRLPNQGHFFNDQKLRYRFNPAGPAHAQVAGCAGMMDYFAHISRLADAEDDDPYGAGRACMRAQEEALLPPLLAWLDAARNCSLIGPAKLETRAPTLALKVSTHPGELAQRLTRHKIMVGSGHFYAYRLLQALGIDPEFGVLRLSFVHYTSPQEIEQLISALDAEIG